MYKIIIRPILFLFPPETIHSIVMFFLKVFNFIPFKNSIIRKIFVSKNKKLQREVFGLTFSNPVGLAAGFDKDAKCFNELANLGFGFIEIGTVTPKPQQGNPQPRLFRLKKDNALINRMGFNNEGVEAAVKQLKKRNTKIIIGGNIGKNKTTPNEDAMNDYTYCFNALFDYVDYFAVNISSPNTPNLRELQDKEPLFQLLSELQRMNSSKPKRKPILLKIAPDLNNEQLDDIVDIVKRTHLDGIIATNTTIERADLKTSNKSIKNYGNGGLSGKPLKKRATEVIRYVVDKSEGKYDVIGVGGIHSHQDAIEKLNAGAKLIQLYTGFIYEGPVLIKEINKHILKNHVEGI